MLNRDLQFSYRDFAQDLLSQCNNNPKLADIPIQVRTELSSVNTGLLLWWPLDQWCGRVNSDMYSLLEALTQECACFACQQSGDHWIGSFCLFVCNHEVLEITTSACSMAGPGVSLHPAAPSCSKGLPTLIYTGAPLTASSSVFSSRSRSMEATTRALLISSPQESFSLLYSS